jgi:multidrug efflux pump subunit AcrA (membrane-fusion protein)
LFQSDKINLENEVTIAGQNLKVAETQMKQAGILLEVQKVKFENAEIDYNRAKGLREKEVMARGSFEDYELLWKKAIADVRHAESGFDLAKVLVEQAQSNLQIAQKKLEDSIIRAPYAGVVTHCNKKLGEYAKLGECVLRIEKPEPLTISVLLSSAYYPLIRAGETPAAVYSLSGTEKLLDAVVSYRAPSIDPMTRTFEIEIDLPTDERLVSGILCAVDLVLSVETGLGVPAEAVLQRGGGRHQIFVARDGVARALECVPGISDEGFVRIAESFRNENVIVKGQAFLNDGAPIDVSGQERKGTDPHVSQ